MRGYWGEAVEVTACVASLLIRGIFLYSKLLDSEQNREVTGKAKDILSQQGFPSFMHE